MEENVDREKRRSAERYNIVLYDNIVARRAHQVLIRNNIEFEFVE